MVTLAPPYLGRLDLARRDDVHLLHLLPGEGAAEQLRGGRVPGGGRKGWCGGGAPGVLSGAEVYAGRGMGGAYHSIGNAR